MRKVKLKYSQLWNERERISLARLLAHQWPIEQFDVALQLAKLRKAVDAELQIIDGQRVDLIRRISGGKDTVPAELYQAFTVALNNMLSVETELDVPMLSVAMLRQGRVPPSADMLVDLEWLLEGEANESNQ